MLWYIIRVTSILSQISSNVILFYTRISALEKRVRFIFEQFPCIYPQVITMLHRKIFLNDGLHLFCSDVDEIWSSKCLLNPGRIMEYRKDRQERELWRLLDLLCTGYTHTHTSVKIMTTALRHETAQFYAVISLANVEILSPGLHNWERERERDKNFGLEVFGWGRQSRWVFCCMKSFASGARWGICKRAASQVMLFAAGE